jgi:NADH-quinone oxidoreductase subunit F
MGDRDRLLGDVPVASLEEWLQGDGGLGYAHALDMAPDEVIAAVSDAGLRGRGGAGFPTGTKWRGVVDHAAEAGAPTYLVCNAAEGEPGTYKDRTLLEHNPYAVLEGMLVGMHAVGAEQAFLAVKEKFTHAVERVVAARDEMVAAGWQGADRVAVVPGPDDYLFGEEKAMLEVIEGKPAMPRIMPPYQTGLFATTTQPNPTVVNNVETWAHVTRVLAHGADWFRQTGTDGSPGTMVFTVTGDVANPGVYELPLGTSLRTLLVDIGGADADRIGAVYSGTSNAVITADMLATPLDFDAMAETGSGLGSGGFVVYDDQRCIVRVLAVLARFLAIESCGQCNACKLGTQTIAELLDRIEAGDGDTDDLDRLVSRIPVITDLARCYLPTGGQLTVGSTLESHWEEFVAHLGTRCDDDRPVPTPLIASIDEDTGVVAWDQPRDRPATSAD